MVDLDTDPTAELQALEGELASLHVIPHAPVLVTAGEQPPPVQPALVVGTKLDLPAAPDGAELLQFDLADRLPVLRTSAVSGAGLDELRRSIVQALDIVRVYAKPPGRPPDLSRPFVLRRGSTVADLADLIHHELRQRLQYAVRCPPGAAPLRVGHQYRVADRDVIELHVG